jgi:hypothetical protein
MLRKSAMVTSAAAFALTFSLTPQANARDKGTGNSELAKFLTYYPTTAVGHHGIDIDYNRIATPGAVFTVRAPGIYVDMANVRHFIITTEVQDGQVGQGKGFVNSMSETGRSRQLKPGETVYITNIEVKNGYIHFELLTTDPMVLADGSSTRYRAEVNFHTTAATADDIKKIIDPVLIDAATAATTAPQSKTVDIGMTTDQVKQSLGIPDKIINLGPKTIFVYKDLKVVFIDSKVSDVQ